MVSSLLIFLYLTWGFIARVANTSVVYGPLSSWGQHGPSWVLSAPDGPHVGPMNVAIRATLQWEYHMLHLHSHTIFQPATYVRYFLPPSINHFTVALSNSDATLIASDARLTISPIGLVSSYVGRLNATTRINHTGKVVLMVLVRMIQTKILMILPLV